MSKQEFIDKLRMYLNGQLDSAGVAEHVRYYENYIRSEMNRGRSEYENMQMLGDPRLIAKTIIDASGYGDNGRGNYGGSVYGAESGGAYSGADGEGTQAYRYARSTSYTDYRSESEPKVTMPGWLKVLIGLLIFFGIISLVFSVLSFLMPILFPIMIVVFITKLFKDWLK